MVTEIRKGVFLVRSLLSDRKVPVDTAVEVVKKLMFGQ